MSHGLSRLAALGVALALLGQTTAAAQTKPRSPKAPEPARPSAPAHAEDVAQIKAINEKISAKWKEQKLTPSARSSDHEFIRRASLDIIGRIAKPQEIDRFLKDPDGNRRAQLIDRLLQSDEFAREQANLWTVWLMTRAGANERGRSQYHEQMHKWLEDQFNKDNLSYKDMVRELLTATGKTNQNGAVNFILTHLGEAVPQDKQRGEEGEGRFTMVPITSRTVKLFLGMQIQCAQCHDHPFNKEWKQKHFWGVNAFFRQVDRRGAPMQNREVDLELVDNQGFNPTGLIYYEKRNGELIAAKPVFLDGTRVEKLRDNRRVELARFITEDKFFSKAYINRMWSHFFGRGFTNPLDDFGSENEPSHPELLDELAAAFEHYNTDPRRLIRWICLSDAYNLSCTANKTNDKTEAEPYFSRMLLKALSPEQLFESLITATQAEMFQAADIRKKIRQDWMRSLTTSFGDDEGNEVTFNGTVVQALLMMNGNDINSAVSSKEKGTVAWSLVYKKTPNRVMDHLYLAALNRPPTPRESGRVMQILRSAPVKSADGLSFWQDLFWALLNSNEFMLNH